MTAKPTKRILLVDGSGYVFRAYHAIRHLSNSSGTPTNAVFGVTRMLLKLLQLEAPTHVAVVMDPKGPTFRHEQYEAYKANRPPAPDDLVVQFPLVLRAIQALGLPLIIQDGFEADDVIASLSTKAVGQGYSVLIISADKDLMQLVSDSILMWDPMKDKLYDKQGVRAKLGVNPDQVTDLLGLMGDSADNIPGIKGVGQKTSAKLLEQYGSLEEILQSAPTMKTSKLKERLQNQADNARLSKKLATLRDDVALEQQIGDLELGNRDLELLDSFLVEMEFWALRRELVGFRKIDTSQYQCIQTQQALRQWVEQIKKNRVFAFDVETTSLDPLRAQIVGISICTQPGQAAYIPVAHTQSGAEQQLSLEWVKEQLAPLFLDANIKRYAQNIKYDAMVIRNQLGIELEPIDCDSMLASYLLDPDRSNHGLDALANDQLGHKTITYEEIGGTKPQKTFDQIDIDQACTYASEDADITFRLCELFLPRLRESGLEKLLTDIEIPLAMVLMEMEKNGVLIDCEKLHGLSEQTSAWLQTSQEKIWRLANKEFNINSPAQLRVILFEQLGLPVVKKTKTGPSTDQAVLEELSALHELPAEILSYRSLSKLRSTYLDVLPKMVHPDTQRVHTRFNQAVAATGRLSSSDPNLQNIPVRTELGRQIREAFVAPKGYQLMSADYSQVELRILAHLSQDETLLASFFAGEDIHAQTAAKIFDVPPEQVTSEMRHRAKAVNFGIIYGQGPFSLSRQLKIPRQEAKEIIDSYLTVYPKVAVWIEKTHEQARRDRYVTTLFGRRRFIPDILSKNFNARSNAERIAQNTPVQGTAADIIKIAMLHIQREIKQQKLRSRMLLQVHDELVFEVPNEEMNLLESLVRTKMEQATELRLPLLIDLAFGDNWAQAH